ncbi:MAG: GIY-YIG nuclease family protein [Acholeplasmatales bacterium]|nr:GIY-YIG nuclease family protein [Acholeplasmatales bacterium]
MGYIYKITNKITSKNYVGLTTRTIQHRWKQHLYNALNYPHLTFKLYNSMRKYGVENFDIELIEEIDTFEELVQREQFWINYYDSVNNGYNMTLGGEGNLKHSYEHIYNLWEEGLMQHEIAANLNISLSSVREILWGYSGYNKNESFRRRAMFNSKKVIQFDLYGKKVKEYNSLKDAADSIGRNPSGITLCCNHAPNHLTAGGFIWLWEDEADTIIEWVNKITQDPSSRRSIPELQRVVQLDACGNILNIFKNAKEAAQACGRDHDRHIGDCCKGKKKTCFGYQWRFAYDMGL